MNPFPPRWPACHFPQTVPEVAATSAPRETPCFSSRWSSTAAPQRSPLSHSPPSDASQRPFAPLASTLPSLLPSFFSAPHSASASPEWAPGPPPRSTDRVPFL